MREHPNPPELQAEVDDLKVNKFSARASHIYSDF
jgi:hypothetical protein